MEKYTRVLTIAGSDSGGGAGIQADLKTISACGCYGMTAITAITAQNTLGVSDIHPVPIASIGAQIRAVCDDIGVDAVKIGMLHSSEVMCCVAELLKEYGCKRIVLDPVMVATSGDPLIKEDAITALQDHLFPVVQLITPNMPEAQLLLDQPITSSDDLTEAGEALAARHGTAVLVKGGHLGEDQLRDVLVDKAGGDHTFFSHPRLATRNTHGTGCSLSSAIAAFWGKGETLKEAVNKAQLYLQGAIKAGADYSLGQGHGPVHHFYDIWR